MRTIDAHVAEVLKMSGSKDRYSGTVIGLDAVGSTAFVLSGERTFFAFTRDPNHEPLKPGQQVTFRISGMSAKDVEVISVGETK